LFGASSFALRLPSIVAGLVLLYFAYIAIKSTGLSFLWRALVVVALAGQSFLMYYVGEARPYLPLAAAVMVVLAYYTSMYFQIGVSRLIGGCAWVAVILGSVSHLYFFPYLIALSVLFAGLQALSKTKNHGVRAILTQAHLPMLTVGALCFAATQLRSALGNKISGYDPYVWVEGSPFGLGKTLSDLHFQFLPLPAVVSLALSISILLSIFAIVFLSRRKPTLEVLVPPLGLTVLGLGMALAISLTSIMGGYEIIPRQWSASLAIVPVAFVWFLGVVSGLMSEAGKKRSVQTLVLASCVVLGGMAILRLQDQWQALQSYSAIKIEYEERFGSEPLSSFEQTRIVEEFETPIEEWANINIFTGGPVWQVCGYFGCPDPLNSLALLR